MDKLDDATEETRPGEEEKYRAPALSKGLDILEMLASEARGRTQVEIAKALGRTTSEIFRMLAVLRHRGYVALDAESDRYGLTTKLFEVAHRHPPIRRLTALAGEKMQVLADRINQSLHLSILHSGRVLVIAQVDCPDNNVTSVRLGAQIPLYDTASGRVLAAWMAPGALESLLDAPGNEDAERRRAFVDDLPAVRAAGGCVNRSLTVEGIINISAPIRDVTGTVAAALTIPYIRRLTGTSRMTAEACQAALTQTCAELSRRLGAQAHED